jgi:hypothetical protein
VNTGAAVVNTTTVNTTAPNAATINVIANCWQAGVWACQGPAQPR